MKTKLLFLIAALLIAAVSPAFASSVNAIERGGTIIARFTDSWIDEQTMEDIFSFEGKNIQNEDAILQDLRDGLSEDEYNDFIAAYEKDSKAEVTVNTIELEPAKGGMLVMNMRRIGDTWYAVFRPTVKVSDSYTVKCKTGKVRKTRDGFAGEYLSTPVSEAETKKVKLKIGDAKADVSYAYKSGNLEICLLATGWGGVAVIHAPIGSDIESRLYIGEDKIGIPVSGYTDGDYTVYCCMLTDTEYDFMMTDTQVSLGTPQASSDSIVFK